MVPEDEAPCKNKCGMALYSPPVYLLGVSLTLKGTFGCWCSRRLVQQQKAMVHCYFGWRSDCFRTSPHKNRARSRYLCDKSYPPSSTGRPSSPRLARLDTQTRCVKITLFDSKCETPSPSTARSLIDATSHPSDTQSRVDCQRCQIPHRSEHVSKARPTDHGK